MEKTTPKETTLYSDEEFRRAVSLYQQLINMLIRELPDIKKDLNIKGGYSIANIKRGLKDGSKQVFWDYLVSTHGSIEELLKNQFDKDYTFRCIKIIFHSGESITLINNPKIKINETTNEVEIVDLPEGILCLDNYRKRLNDIKAKEFDELYLNLINFEKNHFQSDGYREAIGKVMASNKNTSTDIYRNRVALALNLQPE